MNARTELLGVIPGLSNEDYHAGPGVSSSMLSSMAKTPAHCWALHHAPDRPVREQTKPMLTGTLAHCAVLEADAMAARYIVTPEDAPRRPTAAQWKAKKPSSDSQAAMAWWTVFNENAAGRQVITADQYETTQRQLAAVLAIPELAALLSSGQAEQSAYWIDIGTGLLCRCRPDWVHLLPDGRVILLDLKTTSDASPEQFARSVWNFGYYRQAAWYSQGYTVASGREVAGFVFGAVTSDYPYLAVAYMVDDDAMARGAADCRRLLDSYAECQRTGHWPAYGSGVQLLSLPAWAK